MPSPPQACCALLLQGQPPASVLAAGAVPATAVATSLAAAGIAASASAVGAVGAAAVGATRAPARACGIVPAGRSVGVSFADVLIVCVRVFVPKMC